ncbi:uncharacterized protein BCR38DRAFT_471987 [Pseudomassariella vexata]|uniref:Uncharacterized protein n=1 Tax=Pseudomassariella vexata TaxID=1141098 RepID=A0A1Y2EA13_9PEZI|nr:uncharacterized protein BCR38DRAFT_471987 [Pseudomassariella vexata]ORY68420.1 hypothetical protein BCR38DRAFT_471987 [Pseudomassariella vexata]
MSLSAARNEITQRMPRVQSDKSKGRTQRGHISSRRHRALTPLKQEAHDILHLRSIAAPYQAHSQRLPNTSNVLVQVEYKGCSECDHISVETGRFIDRSAFTNTTLSPAEWEYNWYHTPHNQQNLAVHVYFQGSSLPPNATCLTLLKHIPTNDYFVKHTDMVRTRGFVDFIPVSFKEESARLVMPSSFTSLGARIRRMVPRPRQYPSGIHEVLVFVCLGLWSLIHYLPLIPAGYNSPNTGQRYSGCSKTADHHGFPPQHQPAVHRPGAAELEPGSPCTALPCLTRLRVETAHRCGRIVLSLTRVMAVTRMFRVRRDERGGGNGYGHGYGTDDAGE